MTLADYFLSTPRGSKGELAKALGVSRTWVSLLISGKGKASPFLAKKIEEFTKGQVTAASLRPDIFGGAQQ